MVRPSLNPALRDRLFKRAAGACEYCRRRLRDCIWEIEHVLPRHLGGTDEETNLAVACPRCNRNKADQTMATDPLTWSDAPLFNPRTQKWTEHFVDRGAYSVGISATGRATAAVLFRSTEQYAPPDLDWWPIRGIRNEALYSYLNQQRFRRLTNRFARLESALTESRGYSFPDNTDLRLASFARHLLMLESLFTRSTVSDVTYGLELSAASFQDVPLGQSGIQELHTIRSTLLQQQATILALEGRFDEAQSAQAQAAESYQIAVGQQRPAFQQCLRQANLLRKFVPTGDDPFDADDLKLALEEVECGDLRALVYLAESQLYAPKKTRLLGRLICSVEEVLAGSGYGQDFDYARSIVLRRRWWALRLLSGDLPDLNLLQKDLRFWNKIKMYNEIRELALALSRLQSICAASDARDAWECVRASPAVRKLVSRR